VRRRRPGKLPDHRGGRRGDRRRRGKDQVPQQRGGDPHPAPTGGREPQGHAPEQAILVKYVGWGGLQSAFDYYNEKWAKERAELKDLLTDEEYEAARASTLNAHYTSVEVVRAIWDGLGRLGFAGGKVVEPSPVHPHVRGEHALYVPLSPVPPGSPTEINLAASARRTERLVRCQRITSRMCGLRRFSYAC